MIHALVHLTAPRYRYTLAAPTIPTIDVTASAHDKRLVGPAEHNAVMQAAHLLAAAVWSRNEAGWPVAVAVESIGDAHARVTVETIEDSAAERAAVLAMLRDVVTPKHLAYRPDGTAIVVSVPGRS